MNRVQIKSVSLIFKFLALTGCQPKKLCCLLAFRKGVCGMFDQHQYNGREGSQKSSAPTSSLEDESRSPGSNFQIFPPWHASAWIFRRSSATAFAFLTSPVFQVFGGLVWILVASTHVTPPNPLGWVMFVSVFCFVMTSLWMIVFMAGCHNSSPGWAAAVRVGPR